MFTLPSALELWQKGPNPFKRGVKSFDVPGYSKLQVAYAVSKYLRDAPAHSGDPTYQGFMEYLQETAPEDWPSVHSCGAFLSQDPTLIKLGSKLNVLEGAWFKDAATRAEIARLKRVIESFMFYPKEPDRKAAPRATR